MELDSVDFRFCIANSAEDKRGQSHKHRQDLVSLRALSHLKLSQAMTKMDPISRIPVLLITRTPISENAAAADTCTPPPLQLPSYLVQVHQAGHLLQFRTSFHQDILHNIQGCICFPFTFFPAQAESLYAGRIPVVVVAIRSSLSITSPISD
jgi:hypothetical protein